MMNISVDERHAIVTVEVFGEYQTDRLKEVLEAMRGLAERHGHFSELEIHHGKPGNMLQAMAKISGPEDAPDMEFMKKLRKYALVSDNPSLLLRLIVMFAGRSKIKMKIFKAHERDQAWQWLTQEEFVTVSDDEHWS